MDGRVEERRNIMRFVTIVRDLSTHDDDGKSTTTTNNNNNNNIIIYSPY